MTNGVEPWNVDELPMDPAVIRNARPGQLFLLPTRLDENGYGLYQDDFAGFPKTVRSSGIELYFSHNAENRRYLGEYSATDLAINIGMAIAGNLSTDLVKYAYWITKFRARQILGANVDDATVDATTAELEIARFEAYGDHRVIEGLKYRGPIGAIETVLNGHLATVNQSEEADDRDGEGN
ncbi:MAG TPA: hypothetical protein VJ870_00600 [Amycolatopsis sp.]|nr:hypothetical protein [Amycolatopsis sp.]